MASMMAEKILGADRRPNGSTRSTNVDPFHCTAKSFGSERWTGTARYASCKSTFSSRHPLPTAWISAAASSRDVYAIE